MARRTFHTCALLAFLMATLATGLAAQESLGDAARRIRAGKGDDTSPDAGKTSAGKTAKQQPASATDRNADLNATMTALAERDEAAYSTRVRTQLQQER